MKRKIIAVITLCLISILSMIGLSACKEEDKHTHTFSEEVMEQTYLKTAATCEDKAVYFKSCSCGEKGTETFEVGSSLGHSYNTPSYVWNDDSCTATHICLNDASHVETEIVVGVYQKDTDATCTQPEKGHYVATFSKQGFTNSQTEKDSVLFGTPTGIHTEVFENLENGMHGKCCKDCKATLGNAIPHSFDNNYICSDCELEVEPSSGLAFSVNLDRKSYTVSGLGTCTDKEIVIPYTYNNFPITQIDGRAFSETDIEGITILNNITTINSYAFYKCKQLKYVCFGDNITTISNNAFYECSAIETIIFPKNLQTLSSNAFAYCTNLKNIYANDTLITMSLNGMFIDTAWFKNNDNWENNVLYLESLSGNSLYLIDTKDLISGEYIVKEKTRIICSYAFSGWSELTSIVLPDSLVSISSWAFYKCTNLNNVSVGDNIKYLNETSIFEKTALITNTNNYVDGVLYLTSRSQNSKYLIKALTSISGNYEIDQKTKVIAWTAFQNCSSLTGISIPNGVISIGGYAFNLCSSLKEVTIPNSIESIETYTFNACSSLEKCVIGDGVKIIKLRAFGECTALKDITFGSSVEEIVSMAFYHCNNIESLVFPNSLKVIGTDAFEAYGIGKLKYITFGTGIERIESGAFSYQNYVSIISYADSSISNNWYKLDTTTYSPTAANVRFERTTLSTDSIDFGYLNWYRMPDSNYII